MDGSELSSWFRRGAHGLLSPPSNRDIPVTEAPAGLIPGLALSGSGSFLPGGLSTEHRDLLSPSVYQHYMWPSPVLPHPDLLMQSTALSSHGLPTSPLLLGETFPPAAYFSHQPAPLPPELLHGPWANSVSKSVANSPSLKNSEVSSPGGKRQETGIKSVKKSPSTPTKADLHVVSSLKKAGISSPVTNKSGLKPPFKKSAIVTSPLSNKTVYNKKNSNSSKSASNLGKQNNSTTIKPIGSKCGESSHTLTTESPKLDRKTKTISPELDDKPVPVILSKALDNVKKLGHNRELVVKSSSETEDVKTRSEENNNEGNTPTQDINRNKKKGNKSGDKITGQLDLLEQKNVVGNVVNTSKSADIIINSTATDTNTSIPTQKRDSVNNQIKNEEAVLLSAICSSGSTAATTVTAKSITVAAASNKEIITTTRRRKSTRARNAASIVSNSSDVVVSSSDQCIETTLCKDTSNSSSSSSYNTDICVTQQHSDKSKPLLENNLRLVSDEIGISNSDCHLDNLTAKEENGPDCETTNENSTDVIHVICKDGKTEKDIKVNKKASACKSLKLDRGIISDKNSEKVAISSLDTKNVDLKNSHKFSGRFFDGNHIKDKVKEEEKQEDTDDTDIDVGEEVTSQELTVSYSISKGSHCKIDKEAKKKVHATTFTPEIGSVSHGANLEKPPSDVMDNHYDNAMDLRTSPMETSSTPTTVNHNKENSLKSTMKKNDPKLVEGHIDSISSSSEKLIPSLPASPNYMSFDPRILSFYTTEEREKLVQGGWIPSYYSTTLNPHFLSPGGQNAQEKVVQKETESVLCESDKKHVHDGKKVLSRDKKKGSSDGVCKRPSPPTSGTSTIPVGIAIARKRHDEREAERTSEQNQSGRTDSIATQDRVAPAVTTSSSGSLTSNLVVTGGSSGYWLGHGAYSLPPSSRDGAQLQYNPPPGYKIAGDPITGQLYVIPDMARGFGPASPLPSPRSSIKSDQSLESASLEQLAAALSPHQQPLPPPTPPHHSATPQDYTRRLPSDQQSNERRSRSERPRSRDNPNPSRNERPESRSGSEGNRSTRSNQSTPTTVRLDLLSPDRTQTPVTSPTTPSVQTSYRQGITPPSGYPYHFPYYPYYWASHPFQQSLSLQRAPAQAASASISTSKPPTSNSNGPTSTIKSVARNSTSVQTSSNPVIEVGVQTISKKLVDTSVQTDDNSQSDLDDVKEALSGIDSSDNKDLLLRKSCSCSCHLQQQPSPLNTDDIQTDAHDTSKESNLTSNDERASVSEANSDANSDGLQILSALASHIDYFSPLTISTDLSHTSSHSPDVSSVYNGPRSSYFDSNDVGQRKVKTPTSNFRFSLDTMDASELEVRAKLQEIQWMYKEKQKELGKLRPKKDGEQRRSSKGSRRSSKSLSDCDPLSPKPEPIVSPKPPMRKTKAQLKYMPSQQMMESPPFENKDSDVEELRSLFEDTFLETSREKVKERRLSFASKVVEYGDAKPPQFTSSITSTPVTFENKTSVFTKSEFKLTSSGPKKTTTKSEKLSPQGLNETNEAKVLGKTERRKRKGIHGNDLTPAKKRKPGRPKKFGNKGITQTLVSKSAKQFSMFKFDSDENRTSSDGDNKADNEWERRRSERIFLSGTNTPTEMSEREKANKERSRLNNLSHKLKKKYRTMDTTRSNKQNSGNNTSPASTKPKTDDLTTIKSNQSESKSSVIKETDLIDGLQILYLMDGLFYEGRLKEIHPPDVYGVSVNGERGNRPHILSREEVLKDVFRDIRAQDSQELPIGTRICAYWSQQFTCMYPGLVVEGGIPLPKTARGRGLVNVEFDDGDTGKISVEHVRILPHDFPIQEDSDDESDSPAKRRKSISEELLADSWRERRPVKTDTMSNFQVQKQFKKQQSAPASSYSAKNSKMTSSTPRKSKRNESPIKKKKADDSDSSSSSDSDDSEDDSDDSKGNNRNDKQKAQKVKSPKKRSSSPASASGQKGKGRKKEMKILPAHQIWEWFGSCSKRPGSKGKAKKTFYKAIQRGDEIIRVGECAVFLTVGRPHLPYIGRVECFYESRGGTMIVKVKWFYHPEETKGGKKLAEIRGALYESPHSDENDVQTISHKCDVMSYTRYKSFRQGKTIEEMANVYYLAGFYDPTASLIKFEGDVKLI